ncbi:MAG TPA: polysaccharide deacetylase family protein [Candidatus Polarisedimenticolaceae bacterium]|nr:polysaccharide deacetylase family protein [Candidatus Polarisedimenticolaceae bacterium]
MRVRRSWRGALTAAGAEALHRSGATRLLRRAAKRRVQILVYHRVGDSDDAFLPCTPRATFERQMEHLAAEYRVCGLEEAAERLRRDDVADATVVLTFDDGYRDNYTHAFPILRRYGLTATIFLATDAIGTGRILWHDRVFRAFAATRRSELREFGPQRATHPLGTADERAAARSHVLEFLRRLTPEQRASWLDRLVEQLGVDEPAAVPELMLGWDEVREMQRAGLSFGSHTVTHPILATLAPDEARRELIASKAEIERQLERPVTTFAYPNGRRSDFDESSKRLLAETGYTLAVTTLPGANRPAADPLELRRDGVRDEAAAPFAARLTWNRLCS